MAINLEDIPEGAWLRRDGESVLIGAVLGESTLLGCLSWVFTLLWSFSMFVTPVGLFTGESWMILFGLPFFLVGLYLWKHTLLVTFGHVEISLGYEEGTVFSGIKRVGRTDKFVYKEVDRIDEYVFVRNNNVPKYAIRIECESTIKFGGYMTDDSRKFIIKMLQTFMTEGDKVRDSLPVDLRRHLIN